MRRPWMLSTVGMGLLLASSAHGNYIAANWADNRVHYLDNNFNSTGSFATGFNNPNGIATDGTTIWVGSFVQQSVRAFDLAGNPLYTWGAGLAGLQGMEYVNGELAIFDQGQARVEFYNPVTGAFIRSFGAGGTIEGLAYDGTALWGLVGATIDAYNPVTGAFLGSIPNAAANCGFGGTGLSYDGPGQLAIGCSNGNWYEVSSATGGILNSGNNGLQMYGLKTLRPAVIPEPSTWALFGIGLAVAALRRRR